MEEFRNIYDSSPLYSFKGMSLDEIYSQMGLDGTYMMSKHEVESKLIDLIKSKLICDSSSSNFINKLYLTKLRDCFFYRKTIFKDVNDDKYYHALRRLEEIGVFHADKIKPLTDSNNWSEALKYLKCYIEYCPQDEYTTSVGMEQQSERAEAIKRLMKKSAQVEILNDDLRISNLSQCYSELQNYIEKIGGKRFVETVLKELDVHPTTGRILLKKRSKLGIPGKSDIPFAYLINLGFSKLEYDGDENSVAKYYSRAFELATDLCIAQFPVHTTIWENLDNHSEDTIEYFRKWCIYDSIYNLPQCGLNYGLDLIGYIIDKLEQQGKQISNCFSMQDYKDLMIQLSTHTNEKSFQIINPKTIDLIGDKDKHEAILKIVSASSVNQSYMTPLDYEKITLGDSPALCLDNSDILLYPSSIGVMGWYEIMMSEFRKQDEKKKEELLNEGKKPKVNTIDNVVGLILEDYVKNKLKSKDINSICGKYKVDGISGECDIVHMNSGTILLSELKKKTITRKARQGYVYKILLDYAGSLLNSQYQAFRTDTLLRRHDEILLSDGSDSYTLKYDGQEVEKITLTLNNYGPLHERVVIKGIMKEFLKYSFCVKKEEIERFETDAESTDLVMKGYEKLNKVTGELNQYLDELRRKVRKGTDLLENCWFYDIEQFCYIIDNSIGNDDFIKKITANKRRITYTLDFWSEVDASLSIVNRKDVFSSFESSGITIIRGL